MGTTLSKISGFVSAAFPRRSTDNTAANTVKPGNLFVKLEQIMASATNSQLQTWAPKIHDLEIEDQRRGLPLSGLSKEMVGMVRDYVASRHPKWTMAEFQAEYVKRLAKPFTCSLLNLMKVVLGITCQQSTVFVSHAWQYNNKRFFSCVSELENTDDEHFWIDALTVNQFHNQHGFDWWSTTFQQCIANIKKTVLILLPYSDPIPLKRAWCLFEIFCTDQAGIGFEVAMDRNETAAFHSALSADRFKFEDWVAKIDLSRAEAFDPSDKTNILAAVEESHSAGDGVHRLNKRVIEMLRQWLTQQVQSINTVTTNEDYFYLQRGKGEFLLSQGRFSEAETVFRHLIQEAKKQKWVETRLLYAMSRLASSLSRQGKLKEAESLYRQCVAGRERTGGATDSNTLESSHNLALVLRKRGKLSEAVSLYRKVLTGKQSTLGVDHPSTASTMCELGGALLDREDFEEAETLLRTALTVEQKEKGEGHPSTLITLSNLALLLQKTGRLEEAESLRRKELRITEEKLGPLNPETLTSVSNLGGLVDQQGKFEEAEQLYRRALVGRQQSLGKTHPNTLSSAGNLAVFLRQRGRLEESEVLYRSVIATADGKPEEAVHPYTWYFMAQYAYLLNTAGRVDEAVDFCTRALGAQQRTLGGDHPDTNMTMQYLLLMTEATTATAANTPVVSSIEQ